MIELILKMADDNLLYAESLVSDIEDSHLAEQPAGLINHPAWTLGHMVVSQDFALQLLEEPSAADPSWVRLFASGGAPTNDRQNFPTKTELLTALKTEHEKVAAAFRAKFEKRAGAPNPFAPLAPRFPTVGDLVLHLMTTHEASHLGQISAWRRAKELPPVSVIGKLVAATAEKTDAPAEAKQEAKESTETPPAAAPSPEPESHPDSPVLAID